MIHKGFKMKLYDGMAEEYEKRHNELWPEMKDMIHEHGGKNYSIFLDKETMVLYGYIEIEDEELWANYLEVLSVLLMRHKGVIPQLIFGKNDAMKLKSSLTLFSFIVPKEKIIKDVLKFFYADQVDKKTLSILKQMTK